MIFSDYFLIIDKIALSFNSLVLFLFFWYLLYIVKKHHFGYCFSLLFIISACSNHLSLFKLQHLKLWWENHQRLALNKILKAWDEISDGDFWMFELVFLREILISLVHFLQLSLEAISVIFVMIGLLKTLLVLV